MKKIIAFIIVTFVLLLTSCNVETHTLQIVNEDNLIIEVGETLDLDYIFTGDDLICTWSSSDDCAVVDSEGIVFGLSEGSAVILLTIGEYTDSVTITIIEKEIIEVDPYLNVDKEHFYNNYEQASSYLDSYYRSLHGLMSGSIEVPDQAPTISSYQKEINGKLVRNNQGIFSDDGNTYYVVDCYGDILLEIYNGGAYITLEEVAAYIFAFNDIPANYSESKKSKPTESIWGEYLRLNHSNFTGDTSRYPYEPELPNISGCGGNFIYMELDIGTTGTDCDPKYTAALYNNGSSITRGAARIVYSRCDLNRNDIIDMNERYLFYTYNHYNDFQEYLNYYNGWGEIFGNITGGGVISSKTNYNPTKYVQSVLGSLK